MIKAVRVSKTSLKPWELHGPIDQALKTSIQADSVRVCPITVQLSYGTLELELWVDAAEYPLHSPNPAATGILICDEARKRGVSMISSTTEIDGESVGIISADFNECPETELVYGPAILTGAGGVDIPEVEPSHLVRALMGASE